MKAGDVFLNVFIFHLAGSVALSITATVRQHQRQQEDTYGVECECSHVHLCGCKTLLSWYRKTLTANVNSKAA